MGRFLTEDEIKMIEEATMPTDSINKVRDLFLLQCFTGMAYGDLMDFDFKKVVESKSQYILYGKRRKTGVDFVVVLLPKAMEILKKYDYKLPRITNEQYNMWLKIVADASGVNKPIASHYERRTCGMYLLNHGFPIEVVVKVLRHASMKTTESVYAKSWVRLLRMLSASLSGMSKKSEI
ncbi:site-specific integrase [Xylanibacter muris]|uniref:Integrase catalytic domain-containing protein n=1 Tax=Xylanibacter muris TaxID=2736290 RepID=A0ABX2AQL6_9BACT|nr:site-specific integrase [Xylanibacter muris]NPD92332.1 integrase catalytic domain-containing protein [Xylanibacter muris]